MSDNTFEKQSLASPDLAGASRTGLGRWLELVCDGDVAAVAAGLDAVGDADDVEDIGMLAEAIGFRHALHADLKDDESVQYALEQMAEQRNLEGFAAPDEPPAGAARCIAVLMAFAEWVTPRGYAALVLDDGWDNWGAVLVQHAYREELLALSDELGITVRAPREEWSD